MSQNGKMYSARAGAVCVANSQQPAASRRRYSTNRKGNDALRQGRLAVRMRGTLLQRSRHAKSPTHCSHPLDFPFAPLVLVLVLVLVPPFSALRSAFCAPCPPAPCSPTVARRSSLIALRPRVRTRESLAGPSERRSLRPPRRLRVSSFLPLSFFPLFLFLSVPFLSFPFLSFRSFLRSPLLCSALLSFPSLCFALLFFIFSRSLTFAPAMPRSPRARLLAQPLWLLLLLPRFY